MDVRKLRETRLLCICLLALCGVFGLASLSMAMDNLAAHVRLDVTYPVFIHQICQRFLLHVILNQKAHLTLARAVVFGAYCNRDPCSKLQHSPGRYYQGSLPVARAWVIVPEAVF